MRLAKVKLALERAALLARGRKATAHRGGG
jgi:hypothetical protein